MIVAILIMGGLTLVCVCAILVTGRAERARWEAQVPDELPPLTVAEMRELARKHITHPDAAEIARTSALAEAGYRLYKKGQRPAR